jgi:bifunctional DNase/RNase
MKCAVHTCQAPGTFQFAAIDSRRLASETYMCDEHARAFLAEFRSSVSCRSGPQRQIPGAIHVDFEMVIFCSDSLETPACTYLHEIGGTRRFCTLIDDWAWWAIMAQIKGATGSHLLNHSAWAESIRALGGELYSMMVDGHRQHDGWFTAQLELRSDRGTATVGVRPSDGYALAACVGAPIFIAERVLDEAVARERLGPS